MELGKFIATTIREFLTESHDDINELEMLNDDIIKIFAKYINKNRSFMRGDYSYTIKNIFEDININKFNKIKDFIKNNFLNLISISIIQYNDIDGEYIDNKITINVDFTKKTDFDIIKSGDEHDIYYLLDRSVRSTLTHELQHAYDDYRSGGKYNKQNKYVENDLKVYYNSYQELNANFTTAIHNTTFYMDEYELTPTSEEDGIVLIIRKIVDFDVVKRDFIKKFNGWYYLDENIKKKTLNKLGKYYIIVNEQIQKYNQEKHTKQF